MVAEHRELIVIAVIVLSLVVAFASRVFGENHHRKFECLLGIERDNESCRARDQEGIL